jgi:signal transduction histidine kinase
MGAGGYFLASRALRPIDEITRTAGKISASDLSRRIGFTGPRDEVGRLAATFDAMLGRLQSAFERERRFSADAAHELRTPLSVLRGQLDVTLSRKRSPKEYDATLRNLNFQVGRLIALSDDLLMLSRLEQRRLEDRPTVVNLTDVIESVMDEFGHLASEKRIQVACQLPPTLAVEGYSDALLRLFMNLVDNAFKYTPEGGRIEVAAGVSDSTLWVEIFNSVIDLSEIRVEHLFERFYRADSSRSRHSGGAGLGLSIVKEIIEAHGWQISVKKQTGEGITFRIEMQSMMSP